MLNQTVLQGRLGNDIDLKYSTGEKATAIGRFSLAVTSDYKNANGTYDTDWPNCIAFGRTAENMAKFFKKGDMVIVIGRIKTGSYTNKDGNRVNTTDVVVNSFEFCGSKKDSNNQASVAPAKQTPPKGFENISEDIDEELPFN